MWQWNSAAGENMFLWNKQVLICIYLSNYITCNATYSLGQIIPSVKSMASIIIYLGKEYRSAYNYLFHCIIFLRTPCEHDSW